MQAAILHVKTSTYSREEIHRMLRRNQWEPNINLGGMISYNIHILICMLGAPMNSCTKEDLALFTDIDATPGAVQSPLLINKIDK